MKQQPKINTLPSIDGIVLRNMKYLIIAKTIEFALNQAINLFFIPKTK